MRVVRPRGETGEHSGASTLAQTLRMLTPGAADLVDAGFVVAFGVVGLLALAGTFDSGTFLLVGTSGVLLGALVAHITTTLRWHWLFALLIVAVVHLLLGGPVALRADLMAGLLPSGATFAGLIQATTQGWKALLTTLPPVPGEGEFLVQPWLLGLVFGVVAQLVARRTRSPWVPSALGLGLVATTVLLGTFEGFQPLLIGALATVVAFVWLFVRQSRRRALAGTGMGRATRWIAAGILLALALGAGSGLATLMPGPQTTPRTVLRSYVQPPVDVDRYPSPLSGFRKYSSDDQALYEQPLLRVEGGTPDTLVRMAVLDDYNGTAWSASGGMTGDPRTGFQRIGTTIPGTPQGHTSTVRLTIQRAYGATRELAVWLPAPGPATGISFGGDNARAHAAVVRYNIGTSQGLVPDFLKADDTLEVASVSLTTDTGALPAPEGPVLVPDTVSAPLAPALETMGAAAGDPWSRAQEVARVMRETGSWSNGTKPGQQQYLPGHGMKRLTTFSHELVGTDEHYAALYALMLNRLGYPARVVMGATNGADGIIRGRDVRAWVEVSLAGRGWVTIPTEEFMPDRNKEPNDVPPKTLEQQNAVNVPPPNPSRPPGSFDSLFNAGGFGDELDRPARPFDWLGLLVTVVGILGPPLVIIGIVVGVILGAKAVRRHRRRTRGEASRQVAGGWLEFLDRARDLGRAVPLRATRLEQAVAVGGAEASALARAADRVSFAADDPDAEGSATYWDEVMGARRAVVVNMPWWQRWAVALNPRSLVPLAADADAEAPTARRRRISRSRARGASRLR